VHTQYDLNKSLGLAKNPSPFVQDVEKDWDWQGVFVGRRGERREIALRN